MTTVKRIFTVNGKPFFPIGGQASSSGGYNENESEMGFKAVKLLHGNTLLIQVYWEQVEPEEGRFDFSAVDSLINSARRHGIKLVLLWYATWKNANMDYTPAWIKNNPDRFQWVTSPSGVKLWTLSPHCKETFEADKKAFTAFCKHIKMRDAKEQTVIGLQVENEPGILGSNRDYGPEAQAIFDSPVPAKVMTALKKSGSGPAYEIWQQAGGKKSGSWPEIFGNQAGEFMTAWAIATFIDGVAEAGKAVYNIPMYTNVWESAHPMWSQPGDAYPCGCGVYKVLDLYKWVTPHLDMIAPDIKSLDSRTYEELCKQYSREDNPFFLPETPATVALFTAIAKYNLLGYHRMGYLESIVAEDGSARPDSQVGVDTIRIAAAAIPLILKYQGTGKIHAVAQEENVDQDWIEFDGYIGRVQYNAGARYLALKDWRHTPVDLYAQATDSLAKGQAGGRGRGLVFQTGKHEFFMVGAGYWLFLRPKTELAEVNPLKFYNNIQTGRQIQVDEGHFDENGVYVVDRRRNGDQISAGLWLEANIGVLRVRMCDFKE
jgi:hypothetical protein